MIHTSDVMDELERILNGLPKIIPNFLSKYEITKRSDHVDATLFGLYGTPITVTFTEEDFEYIFSKMYPDSYIVQIYLERFINAVEELELEYLNSDEPCNYKHEKNSMLNYIKKQTQKEYDVKAYKELQNYFKDLLKETFGIVTIPV